MFPMAPILMRAVMAVMLLPPWIAPRASAHPWWAAPRTPLPLPLLRLWGAPGRSPGRRRPKRRLAAPGTPRAAPSTRTPDHKPFGIAFGDCLPGERFTLIIVISGEGSRSLKLVCLRLCLRLVRSIIPLKPLGASESTESSPTHISHSCDGRPAARLSVALGCSRLLSVALNPSQPLSALSISYISVVYCNSYI